MRWLWVSFVFAMIHGCSGGAGTENSVEAGPTGTVVVLSSRDEKFMHGLWDLVKKKHPSIDLVVDYGKDSGYLDRLGVEKDAPVADLYLSKASGPLESAANSGLFAPIPEDLAARVPVRFQGANNQWVGLSARARVLVRRKGLDMPPNTLEDLIQPSRAGQVARTVATNSSFVGGVTAYIADHGEEKAREWLIGLQTNSKGNVHPKHTPAVAAVAEGQADVALVNHYYFYRNILGKTVDPTMTAKEIHAKLDTAPIEIIYPDTDNKGVAWNVSGAGLVKGGPNPAAAQAVLAVLLSDEGQKAYAFTNREYPAVDGLPSPVGVAPASSFTWSATSMSDLATHQAKAVALIQELGLE